MGLDAAGCGCAASRARSPSTPSLGPSAASRSRSGRRWARKARAGWSRCSGGEPSMDSRPTNTKMASGTDSSICAPGIRTRWASRPERALGKVFVPPGHELSIRHGDNQTVTPEDLIRRWKAESRARMNRPGRTVHSVSLRSMCQSPTEPGHYEDPVDREEGPNITEGRCRTNRSSVSGRLRQNA